MRHFSRFIRACAKRMGLKGPWAGNAVAFRHHERETIVVVANPFPDQRELVLRVGDSNVRCTLPAQSFHTMIVQAERASVH